MKVAVALVGRVNTFDLITKIGTTTILYVETPSL